MSTPKPASNNNNGVETPNSNSNSNSNSDLTSNQQPKKMPINKVTVGQAKGPNLKNVKSKVGSLNNVKHKPAGGDKKIESQKLKWETKSRVGSLDNATHKPKGGNVKVLTQKLEWNAKPKVGSLDNVKHKPSGGNVKIFDEKYIAPNSVASSVGSGTTTPNIIMDNNNNTNKQIEEIVNEINEKHLLD